MQAACAVWSLAYLCYRHYRGRRSPSYLSCGDEAQGSAKLGPKEGPNWDRTAPRRAWTSVLQVVYEGGRLGIGR